MAQEPEASKPDTEGKLEEGKTEAHGKTRRNNGGCKILMALVSSLQSSLTFKSEVLAITDTAIVASNFHCISFA